MNSLREARAAAVQRHLRALEDDWRKALPRLLDELDTIDREHAAEAAFSLGVPVEPRAVVVPMGEPLNPKPPARRRTTRKSST